MTEFRPWGHKLIDWVADYLQSPARYPVLSTIAPNDIVKSLPARGPEKGEPMDAIFADFEDIVLPGITHWNHPNFLAYFANTSSPPAVLAELLAAALNANGILWKTSPAVTELEVVTLRWLLDWFGLPSDWFGMILDTASMGNLHALAAARARACPELRDQGSPNNLIVYCSEHAHSCIEKGAMALGFGRNNVRRIPSDESFRMRTDLLEQAIAQDRAAGLRPCCIAATVGTTSTTAIDPVRAIAAIAEREGLWLHVDTAYAGSAGVVPEFRWVLDGCERADSLVFNPHKWLMVPVDCSVFYCRHRDVLRHAFSLSAEYLEITDAGLNMTEYGIPLGRRFRALKLWFVLRYYGREGLARIIREQIAMARDLQDRIAAHPLFEIFAPNDLSVVCFRLRGTNEANRVLMESLNQAGPFFYSNTTLNGQYVLRIAVGNMGTTRETLDQAWSQIAQFAGGLSESVIVND
ncbi:MAG TPA: aminotransferase class V-fold PLP-dependent enzyme [Bryobacteraceae bacterium]|jgi:aromatic-L-amino-acid decarboxylase|nr:aminotransferase class V-fold PLP-dependent enzyme [Bryobacteraceae bacterium]